VVASIAGNQDRQIFEATSDDLAANKTLAFVVANLGEEPIAWLRTLPTTAVMNGKVFLCHGAPTSDTPYLLEDINSGGPVVRAEHAIVELLATVREPVLLCGRAHIPRMVQLVGGQLIVNPGSVGVPAYDDEGPASISWKHMRRTLRTLFLKRVVRVGLFRFIRFLTSGIRRQSKPVILAGRTGGEESKLDGCASAPESAV
jgi:diadenosine tetraphosphatase ApaH/serine/threonine PP2A family protein phosphatase